MKGLEGHREGRNKHESKKDDKIDQAEYTSFCTTNSIFDKGAARNGYHQHFHPPHDPPVKWKQITVGGGDGDAFGCGIVAGPHRCSLLPVSIFR